MDRETRKFLLRTARLEIAGVLKLGWKDYRMAEKIRVQDEELIQHKGTFVTLTINDNLRGCIGQLSPDDAVIETVKENAVSSAFRDPRFPPLTPDEFYKTNVEISVLSVPSKLEYTDTDDLLNKIKQGEHGLIIRSGFRAATFLPQVWEDLPAKEEFFSHLCAKAGLASDEWKRGKLEVHTYTVEHFDESGLDLKI